MVSLDLHFVLDEIRLQLNNQIPFVFKEVRL